MAFKVIKNGEKKKSPSAISYIGREEEISCFFANYEYLQENYDENESKVLCFYGFSDMGKTTLCKQIIEELGGRKYFYYDFESGADVSSFLKSTVFHMKKKYGYSFSLYEYVLYLFSDEKGRKNIDSSFLEYVKKTVKMIPTEDIVSTLLLYANNDDVIIRKFLDNYRNDIGEIENKIKSSDCSNEEVERILLTCYAKDFIHNQVYESKPFVIFLDSYERIINPLNSAGNSEKSDMWLRSIEDMNEGLMLMLPNVLWVITGRDRLRWSKYANIWDENALEQHELSVLLEEDAVKLLKAHGLTDTKKAKKLHKLVQGNPKHMILAAKSIVENKDMSLEEAVSAHYDTLVDDFMRGYKKNIRNAMSVVCSLDVWTDKNLEEYSKKSGIKVSKKVCDIIKKSGYVFVERKKRFEIVPYLKDILTKSSFCNVQNDNINSASSKVAEEEFVSDIVLREREFEADRQKREEKYEQILDEQKNNLSNTNENGDLSNKEKKASDDIASIDSSVSNIHKDDHVDKVEVNVDTIPTLNIDFALDRLDKKFTSTNLSNVELDNNNSLMSLNDDKKDTKDDEITMDELFSNTSEGIDLFESSSLDDRKKSDSSIGSIEKDSVDGDSDIKKDSSIDSYDIEKDNLEKVDISDTNDESDIDLDSFMEKNQDDTISFGKENTGEIKKDDILNKYSFEGVNESNENKSSNTDNMPKDLRQYGKRKPVIRDNKVSYEVFDTGEIDDLSKYGSRLTEQERNELMKDVSNNTNVSKKKRQANATKFENVKAFDDFVSNQVGKMSFYDLYEETHSMFESMLHNKKYDEFKRIFSKIWAKLIRLDENSKEYILFSKIYAIYLKDTGDKRNLVYCLDSMASVYFKVGFNEFEMMEIEDTLNVAYYSVGMYKKALEISEKNYERKVKIMGERHPVSINSLYSQALIYSAMGRNVKALNINIESYSKAKETMGDSHPDTLANLDSLGNIYIKLEMFEGALEAKRKVFDQYVKICGENHPKSVNCLHTIGNIYVGLGQFEKAEKILNASHKKLVSLYGVKSREAVKCNDDIKHCVEERKKVEGKEKFY